MSILLNVMFFNDFYETSSSFARMNIYFIFSNSIQRRFHCFVCNKATDFVYQYKIFHSCWNPNWDAGIIVSNKSISFSAFKALYDAQVKAFETEIHLRKVADRENGRIQQELNKLDKDLRDQKEKKNFFEVNRKIFFCIL